MTTVSKKDLPLLVKSYDEADLRAFKDERSSSHSLDELVSTSGMPYIENDNGYEVHGPYRYARTNHNPLSNDSVSDWRGVYSELAFWCPASELWLQGLPMVRPIEDADNAPEGAIATLCCRDCKEFIGFIS